MSTVRRLALAIALAMLCGVLPGRAQTVLPVVSGVFSFPLGVALDAAGNAYVANNASNTITKVTPAGAASIFVAAEQGLDHPTGLAFDAAGNLYIANGGNGKVSEVTPSGAVSVFVGGLGTPAGLAFDTAGNLYVSDSSGDAIREVSPAAVVKLFASDKTLLSTPEGLAFDAAGNLYVANLMSVPGGPAVSVITPAGAISSFADATPDFLFAVYLSFDGSGNLYVTSALGPISEISPSGVVTTLDTTSFVSPEGIAADRAGNLYIADVDAMTLSKRTPNGTVTLVAGNALAVPKFLTTDPAGNIYVANSGSKTVTKVTPQGTTTILVPRGSGIGDPVGAAFGPDGILYVGDDQFDAPKIDKVAADGTVTLFADLTGTGAEPQGMAFTADGTLYVADSSEGAILRITADGTVSTFLTAAAAGLSLPEGLAFDVLGNLYIADAGFGSILKVTPAGTVSTFVPASVGLTAPQGLAFDGNGTLYVVNSPGGALPPGIVAVSSTGVVSPYASGVDGLGNPMGLTFQAPDTLYTDDFDTGSLFSVSVPSPSAPPVSLAAAVLPDSRSVQVGAPATVFASMINTGTAELGGCGVSLRTGAPAALSMSFQATNPTTNQPIGTRNQTVTIAPNATQSFVLSFQSTAALSLPGYAPVFACTNSQPAPATNGVDTVDLGFSTDPVADIIALVATVQPGVVQVPLIQNQAGAFAVASVNVGSAASLTVTADTGAATLPLSILLCPTDPVSGQCLEQMAPSISTTIDAGATPTFSVFVTATAPIAFAPATSRIFVRFLDTDGQSHGSTSVAVETEQ